MLLKKEILTIKLWHTNIWKMHPNFKMNKVRKEVCTLERVKHKLYQALLIWSPNSWCAERKTRVCPSAVIPPYPREKENISYIGRMLFIITKMKNKNWFSKRCFFNFLSSQCLKAWHCKVQHVHCLFKGSSNLKEPHPANKFLNLIHSFLVI